MNSCFHIFCLLLLSYFYSAQTAGDATYTPVQFKLGVAYSIKTNNGESYQGFVQEESKEFVTLINRMTQTSVQLRKSTIVRVTRLKNYSLNSELTGENVHAKNYMFSSSAFLFEGRKLRTTSHWLLLENINYALSDNWAVNLNTLAFYPLSLGVSYAHKIDYYNHAGASVFGIGNITSVKLGSVLFGYGGLVKYTQGDSNNNLTLSTGILGLSSDLFYITTTQLFVNTTFVSAAYCNRFSKKSALNIEAWYLPDVSMGLCGAGLKFTGNEYICWTVGCYALMSNQNNSLKLNLRTLPIPYIGISRRFD